MIFLTMPCCDVKMPANLLATDNFPDSGCHFLLGGSDYFIKGRIIVKMENSISILNIFRERLENIVSRFDSSEFAVEVEKVVSLSQNDESSTQNDGKTLFVSVHTRYSRNQVSDYSITLLTAGCRD